jgi:cytochrome bd ubiquinol oxidase subunit II
VASGRVPPGLAAGHLVTSWLNPTGILGGVLAVGTCAYLAACFLCHDAVRLGEPALAEAFRRRALGAGLGTGALALAGIAVLRADAPALFHGLTHRGLPLVVASAVAGVGSLVLLARRWYRTVRVSAAAAVASVLWGWAVAQYPLMLPPGTRYDEVAATRPVLVATLVATAVGAVLLLPSLLWLLMLFGRAEPAADQPG